MKKEKLVSVASPEAFCRKADISHVAGPLMQSSIAEANRVFAQMLRDAALLGDSEPLASDLLGLSSEAIQEFSKPGFEQILIEKSLGFPLFIMNPKLAEPSVLRSLLQSGMGSEEAMSAILSAMKLPVIRQLNKMKKKA